jgi:hypothetical protein
VPYASFVPAVAELAGYDNRPRKGTASVFRDRGRKGAAGLRLGVAQGFPECGGIYFKISSQYGGHHARS